MESEKTATEIVVDGLMASVSSTEQFLDLLRNVGKYDYRKKIHLSDVELTEKLNENITAQLMAIRDYYLLHEFVKQSGHAEAFALFRTQCLEEVKRRMESVEIQN